MRGECTLCRKPIIIAEKSGEMVAFEPEPVLKGYRFTVHTLKNGHLLAVKTTSGKGHLMHRSRCEGKKGRKKPQQQEFPWPA